MDSTELRKSLYTVLVLAALSCLWGCQGKTSTTASLRKEEEKIKPGEKLVADPDRRLADVPIPLGAHFKDSSSKSSQTGSRRRVDHNYGIWAKKAKVRMFFRDNMPGHGWKLTNSITDRGVCYLSYKKGRESCKVSIGPTSWNFQTRIGITIQPVSNFN